MSEGKTIGYTIAYVLIVIGLIVACILIFFGVLSIWGAFTPGGGQPQLLTLGGITVFIGLAIVAAAVGVFVFLRIRRARETQAAQQIIQKIDLSGEVKAEKLKCQNCGGELSKDNISVQAGAVFVSCPYCNASYQNVEEPKW
jgi:Zn finger protein HypA/HybF involved in hydrogenase expression